MGFFTGEDFVVTGRVTCVYEYHMMIKGVVLLEIHLVMA